MNKHFSNIFGVTSLSFILASALLATNYESYLESWDSGWQTVMQGMPPTPSTSTTSYDGVILDIAFASYTFPGLNGIQFNSVSSDTQTVINYVHAQNGLAKISYGGASYAGPNYFISQTSGWPNNIPSLVSGVTDVVTSYGFDGVDFDIEDSLPGGTTAQDFANSLFSFLTQIRAALPNKIISLTIPGQGWGTYWEYLAKQVAGANTVDCINFMEYDIWVGAPSYAEQIEADLTTYLAPTTTSPAPNYSPGWGIPPKLIQIGLMPGNDDTSQFLSVADAQTLTITAIDLGLYGIMTWDLNRDGGTDPVPSLEGASPYAYTNAIREIIFNPEEATLALSHIPRSHISRYRSRNKRAHMGIKPFERQAPPPHGAPSN
jgi:hypothetical protein